MDEAQQLRHVDGDHALRSAGSDIQPRLVWRNDHAEGLRCVALQLVERNLHGLAHVRAKERECVSEGATVFEMRQGHEVLGMVLRHRAQTAVAGECQVKNAGNRVQRNAIHHLRFLRIDHRDLRFGRGAVFEAGAQRIWVGINMGCVNPLAIRRKRKVTCPAPRQQPLLLHPCLRIEHRHVVGDAVGDKDILPCRVFHHAGWFRAHIPRSGHSQGARIDDRKRVVPRVCD